MLKNGVDVSLLPLLSPWVLEFESLAAWHLVVVAAVVSVFVLYCLTKPLEVQPLVPGPRRYPWPVGYLWHPIRHWHEWPTETTRLAELYGRTWGGPDEDNVRHVLKTIFANYGKGDMWQRVLGEMLGVGIFAVDGELWNIHRKLMANRFSHNLMQHASGVARGKLMELLETFKGRDERAAGGGSLTHAFRWRSDW